MEGENGMGVHILANFFECSAELLKKVEPVRKIVLEVVEEAKLSMLKHQFHQYEPHGVTGVVLIGESHLSVHTWPEYRSMAIDIFCCYLGQENKEKALRKAEKTYECLKEKFMPGKINKKIVMR